MFAKAKWIWKAGEILADEFADFVTEFDATGISPYTLTIAADSNYTVYINGELAAFGQYADYPTYKVCDRVDVTKLVKAGKNRLVVVVWYYGENTQTYIHGDPGVIFEICEQDAPICYSSEQTLSRLSRDYIPHIKQYISGQLGFTYHYDATSYDGFIEADVTDGFAPSVLMPMISTDFTCRPIKMLELATRSQSQMCLQGLFDYVDKHDRPDVMMQHAALRHRYPEQITDMRGFFGFDKPVHFKTDDKAQGIFFVVDLGQEWAGFLDFDIEVPHDCQIEIGYGEHLADGRCRTSVRGFSCDYRAKQGRNSYLHTFRRFGCRYVQFFVNATEFTVYYAGLRPTLYPVTAKKLEKGNLLQQTIYDVCANTLLQCMHEHYEDCPWREQALYCMDSRNQMLCGYYAFGEYDFPRANLELMSKERRADGLLSICFPSDVKLAIPSFSLHYFTQVYEYYDRAADTDFVKEIYPKLCSVMKAFTSRSADGGCIPSFVGKEYWNFYEWSDGLSGNLGSSDALCYEAALNFLLVIALRNMSKLADAAGEKDEFKPLIAPLIEDARKRFFCSECGLFLDTEGGKKSELVNALAILSGACSYSEAQGIAKVLASKDSGLTPATLSMLCFKYDAMITVDRSKYADIILDDIRTKYGKMLDEGATSFWETEDGAAAFGNAGSLCHGWSALPIYYYELLMAEPEYRLYR